MRPLRAPSPALVPRTSSRPRGEGCGSMEGWESNRLGIESSNPLPWRPWRERVARSRRFQNQTGLVSAVAASGTPMGKPGASDSKLSTDRNNRAPRSGLKQILCWPGVARWLPSFTHRPRALGSSAAVSPRCTPGAPSRTQPNPALHSGSRAPGLRRRCCKPRSVPGHS